MKYTDNITKNSQVKFGGYNHSLYARDGDIYDMQNVTSEHYPLISQRDKRGEYKIKAEDLCIYKAESYEIYQDPTTFWRLTIVKNCENSEIDIITLSVGEKIKIEFEGERKDKSGEFEVKYFSVTEKSIGESEEKYYSIEISLYGTIDEVMGSAAHCEEIVEVKQVLTDDVTVKTICAMGDALYFVTNEGDFYYDNVFITKLTPGKKSFAKTGTILYIIPDNVSFEIDTRKITKKSKTTKTKQLSNANYYRYIGATYIRSRYGAIISDEFAVGDVVNVEVKSIKGQYHFVNAVIRKIDDSRVRVDFAAELVDKNGTRISQTSLFGTGSESHEFSEITITNSTPELTCICAADNRIWGCDKDTIYCTAFGKPNEWFYYEASSDGNDADVSLSITPFTGNNEPFTGCVTYNGTPIFFKENRIYKVYGDKASNFTLSEDELPGVMSGSSDSIKIVNEYLYYLSNVGVMRYSGNSVTNLTREFNESFWDGVSGCDNEKYYISMTSEQGDKLFCYDTSKGLWVKEDNTRAVNFFTLNDTLFMLDNNSNIMSLKDNKESAEGLLYVKSEDDFESFLEFGDCFMNTNDKKAISKLYLRLALKAGSKVSILINYDSEKDVEGNRVWKEIKTMKSQTMKTFTLPIIPRRCDHFRLKIKAKGEFILYQMSYDYYVGTSL